MKLIIGLGNPGEAYAKTRHNIGFMALDLLASKYSFEFREDKKLKGLVAAKQINGEKVIFLKPLTYMNLSGESVISVMNFFKIAKTDIIVICDDLDSNPGRVRLRENGSAGGHNGLKNIILHLKTEEFKRIKIGIGRNPLIPVADYVLGRISKEDEDVTNEALNQAVLACSDFIDGLPFQKISSKYSKK